MPERAGVQLRRELRRKKMDSKQSSYKADIILAIVLLVGCTYVYWECLSLPESPYEPLGPAFVPKALCILIGISAVWVLMQGLQKMRSRSLHDKTSSDDGITDRKDFVRHPFLALTGVFLTLAYIASMHLRLLGFRSATIIFILVLGITIMKYEKKTLSIFHLLTLLIIACIMGLGGYYLFTQVFYVNLP